MHSTMLGYHWLSYSTMRATAAVRQRTHTENYSLPAQSTQRMAGITAVKFDPQVFRFAKKNYAEFAYGLRLWSVLVTKIRVWVRVKARALSF